MHIRRIKPSDIGNERSLAFDRLINRAVTSSGVQVVQYPVPSSDLFHLTVMSRTGARLESPANAGISHFLEHMMFRGSAAFPEYARLAEEFEWLGGEWNAETGYEHMEFSYTGISHTAPEVMALFRDFLENPAFQDIEAERSIIQRELDGETNDHGNSTDLDLHTARLFWPGTSRATPLLGTPDTINSFTTGDLRTWQNRYLTAANTVITVAGGPPGILELILREFSDFRSTAAGTGRNSWPAVTAAAGPRSAWVEHSDNEYEVQLSFLCGSEWSQDAVITDLVARILCDGFSARLTKRLREELGLVYSISADAQLYSDNGTVDIRASCAQDQLEKFLAELTTSMRDLAASGSTPEEFDRARLRSVIDIELTSAQPAWMASRVAWHALWDKPFSLVEKRAQLEHISYETVNAAIQRIFSSRGAGLVVLGPAEKGISERIQKFIASGIP